MSLTSLHTNWEYGSYQEDRDREVKVSENAQLFTSKSTDLNAHVAGNSIDVGYGYDLFQNLSNLKSDLQGYVTSGSNLDMVYQLINEYLNMGNPRHFSNLDTLAVEINKYFAFGTETNAAAFLSHKLNGFETTLDNILGYTMPPSRERAALMSLCYNRPAILTDSDPNKSIAYAINNDDRIRAWYLIRYRCNGDKAQGIANRRYRTSDDFGLWSNGGPTNDELANFETFLKTMNSGVRSFKLTNGCGDWFRDGLADWPGVVARRVAGSGNLLGVGRATATAGRFGRHRSGIMSGARILAHALLSTRGGQITRHPPRGVHHPHVAMTTAPRPSTNE